MEKERDVRLVRFDLRLRVGADGDPLDNELHNAWSALPENTVIRNDWLRRRLLLGHILEREGLTELLAVIGRLTGAPATAHGAAGTVPATPPKPAPAAMTPAVADFLPPELDLPVPAEAPKPSARKQLGGLLPAIAPHAPKMKEKEKEKSEQKHESEHGENSRPASDKDANSPPAPHSQDASMTETAAPEPDQPAREPDQPARAGRPPLAGDRG